MSFARHRLKLRGQHFDLEVRQAVKLSPEAPRLLLVSYQPTPALEGVVRVALETIQRYTPEDHELWVIDNNSPPDCVAWLRDYPNINLVLSHTDPIPPAGRRLWRKEPRSHAWGSYANATALEIGAKLIDPQSRYMMTLHQDIMPCREGWLSFLRDKIGGEIGAAGVRLDRVRSPEGVLHVLGYMVDFQLMRRLKLDFYPDLPRYDVGDKVTVGLRKAGYDVFACRNTLRDPDLINLIPPDNPLHHLHVDRSFDDAGNVIFLHLGRGVRQALGEHEAITSPADWVTFAHEHLLS